MTPLAKRSKNQALFKMTSIDNYQIELSLQSILEANKIIAEKDKTIEEKDSEIEELIKQAYGINNRLTMSNNFAKEIYDRVRINRSAETLTEITIEHNGREVIAIL